MADLNCQLITLALPEADLYWKVSSERVPRNVSRDVYLDRYETMSGYPCALGCICCQIEKMSNNKYIIRSRYCMLFPTK
jgi:hypothetical protein